MTIRNILLSSILFFLSLPVFAVPFQNGDFSNAGGWIDSSATGSAQVVTGEAILETGDSTDPFSAVLVQGDDGFFNFGSPITLASDIVYLFFDAEFTSLGSDGTETGGGFFSDALFISLYDSDDSNFDFINSIDPDDIMLDPGIDSSVIGWNSYQFDISSLAGFNIALSFELSDENDGFNSKVTLDNVRFESASTVVNPVPEPQTLALLGLGVLSLLVTRRKRKK